MKTYRVKVRDRSYLVKAKDENEAFTKVKNKVKDTDDYTYEVIKEQITSGAFPKKVLMQKAYNGLTRGSMTKEEYNKLFQEIISMKDSRIKDSNYTIKYEDMNTDEQGTAQITAGDIRQAFTEFEKYLKKNGIGADSTYVVSVTPDDGNKGIKGSLKAINARIRYKVGDAKRKVGDDSNYPVVYDKYVILLENTGLVFKDYRLQGVFIFDNPHNIPEADIEHVLPPKSTMKYKGKQVIINM